ncbi:hypothetical protein C0416_02600 [bacterium]|nr:hypothetical protein [bacterium]
MNENNKHEGDMQKEFKKHLDGAASTFNDIKNPGKFDFKAEFMNAIEILKLNEKKMTEVATRKTTATAALLFILIGMVAVSLGMYLMIPSVWRPSLMYLVFSMVYSLVAMLLVIFATDFVGSQLFKGKGDFGQLFRVFGYSYILMIPYILLAVAPGLASIISLAAGVWMLVVSYKIIMVIKKLNPTHTIFTILIVAVGLGVISAILAQFGVGFGFGGYGAEINNLNDALDALSRI